MFKSVNHTKINQNEPTTLESMLGHQLYDKLLPDISGIWQVPPPSTVVLHFSPACFRRHGGNKEFPKIL